MHRPCSYCGHQSNSFSRLFTMPYDQHICPYDSSSTVDCTLSLATPSTRLISDGVSVTVANPAAVARRCANCHTTSTPLWRNGPRGPKSLCNACGIRFKKEERRAATVVTGNTQTAATHKLPEFRFVDEVDDRDSTLMSWRLNVTDRAGLVHDYHTLLKYKVGPRRDPR